MSRHAPSTLLVVGVSALLKILFLTVVVAPADAQRYGPRGPTTVITPLPPVLPPNIGSPVLGPTLPELPPGPKIEIQPAPPAAVQLPAVRVVRFRCDLAPDSDECNNPDSGDGGGDDETCNCARDICRTNRIGNRVCEKLR
jgi:hypothetical protein